jgi:hypothetical protein
MKRAASLPIFLLLINVLWCRDSDSSQRFNCSKGFIERCEYNDQHQCIWVPGTEHDLETHRRNLEEGAFDSEENIVEAGESGHSLKEAADKLRNEAKMCKLPPGTIPEANQDGVNKGERGETWKQPSKNSGSLCSIGFVPIFAFTSCIANSV